MGNSWNMENNVNLIEIVDINEIQEILYKILKEFHKICENNHLYYILFGGSNLGAVRHGAIIPWDDDIDVAMPRDDYDKFSEIVKSYPDLYYYINQSTYRYPYGKLCLKNTLLIENGAKEKYKYLKAYLDIFPVDGYPQHDESNFFKKLSHYNRKRIVGSASFSIPKNKFKKLLIPLIFVKYCLCTFINVRKNCDKIVSLLSSNPVADSDYLLMDGACTWHQKGKIPKYDFFSRKMVKFGPLSSYILENSDFVLKQRYGDYMKLPPEENRISNHNYQLFIRK